MDEKKYFNPEGDAKSNVGPDGKPLTTETLKTPAPVGQPGSILGLPTTLNFYHPNLKQGDQNVAVHALQMIIAKKLGKKMKSKIDGQYGPLTVMDVHNLKVMLYHRGLPGDGKTWGLADWKAVQIDVITDKNILTLLHVQSAVDVKNALRSKIVAAAWFGYTNRMNIHYQEVRPMPSSLSLAAHQVINTDCSGFVTLCYKAGGASDPNGFNYNGYGFTGTLLNHGKPVTINNLQPGDLCFYGHPTVVHTAIYVGKGMVISNGLYPMQYLPTSLDAGNWFNCARSYI